MLSIIKTLDVDCEVIDNGLILVIQCPECPNQSIAMKYDIIDQKYRGQCANCNEKYISYDAICEFTKGELC